jgi:hypothetical protein
VKLLSFGSDDQVEEDEGVVFTKKPMFRPERALRFDFGELDR